jgi:hypothetical protein
MRMRRTKSLVIFHLLGVLLMAAMSSAKAVEIVCNRDVPVIQMSRMELQAFFTMRLRSWPDGAPTRVFVLPDNAPAHAEFSKRILDMFPYQLRRYWDRLVFSGTGQAPTELNSLSEMYDRVASTPGAIGYLPSEFVDSKIRIMKVISQ